MSLTARILAIGALGFVLGDAIRDHFEKPTDRVTAAIDLFRSVCVPLAKGQREEADFDFDHLAILNADSGWMDPESNFSLKIGDRDCVIADSANHMNVGEQERFSTMVQRVIDIDFPLLRRDPDNDMPHWDEFAFWVQFPPDHPQRWGVMLMRVNPIQEGAQSDALSLTSLRVVLPYQQPSE